MTMLFEVTTVSPRIYVACLSSYNNGKLYGTWIDATQDAESIQEEVSIMLAGSSELGAEEYAIHDYEGFGDMRLSEYSSFEDVSKIAGLIVEHGVELVAGLMSNYSDLEEVEEALTDNYIGEYDSLEDYMQEITEDTIDIPESLRYYIDYKSMAHDEECSGTYTQIEVNGRVHIFSNC